MVLLLILNKVVLMLILLHHVKIQLTINGIDLMMLLLILFITFKNRLLNLELLINYFIKKNKIYKLNYYLFFM